MKRGLLVVLLIWGILCFTGCNENNSVENSLQSDISNAESSESSEENSEESKLVKPQESSVASNISDILAGSNVYNYIKAFECMESAKLHGTIKHTVSGSDSVSEYYCYKDGDKLLSIVKVNGEIGWAELQDGNKYYALNMEDKVYEKLDSLSLNTYNELLMLFKCADGFEAKGAKEAIHLSNSEYGINSFLDCTIETDGIKINIVKNDGTSTGKEISISVGKLKDEDKKLFDISGYTEQEEESSDVNIDEISIPKELE